MSQSPNARTVVSPTLPGVENEAAEPEGATYTSSSPPSPKEMMPEDPLATTDLLTSDMLAEEKDMAQQSKVEEERILQQHAQVCGANNGDHREQRYRRLKFLLSKSNLYTNYLVGRMERQAQDQKDKLARQEKRKQNKLEKEKQPKEVRTSARNAVKTETSSPKVAPSRKRKAAGTEPARKRRKRGEETESQDEKEEESPVESQEEAESQEDNSEKETSAEPVENFMTNIPDKNVQPELLTGGTLRPYQMEGYNWLKVLYENGVNGILADEMGLGKTIQCIAAIADMCANAVTGPFLIVAPLSVVPNWVSEFQRFTPNVPVMLYHGSKEEREVLRRKIKRLQPVKPGVSSQPVVVTSYEVAMNDRAHLSNFAWKYLIVDEGHRIKNAQCRLIKELKMYSSTHRLLLTGTPLQNNLAELWSLLNFLLPEIFDDLASFEFWFDLSRLDDAKSHEAIVAEEQRDNILAMLHQILKPFMLRRMKCDVELDVPPKSEIIVYAPLSTTQATMYKAALDNTIEDMIMEPVKVTEENYGRGKRERRSVNYASMIGEDCDTPVKNKRKEEENLFAWCDDFVIPELKSAADILKLPKGNGKSEVTLQLRNKMMLLRRLCNHPYLVEYPLSKDGQYRIDEGLIKECGKMQLLDQMLTELLKHGHKVLIFSQMTSMLDIIGDYLYHRGLKHSRLDGSMPFTERVEQIKQFSQDADVGVFLLSTRAGGLGLNLVAADTVIIYDSDWNPQADLQAQDRCHRIGQTKPVMIYRLVTGKTIDQKIVEKAAAKRKLEKMVIIKGKFKKGIHKLDKQMSVIKPEELMELLKSTDFDERVDIEKKRGSKQAISQRDLEKLLDRSHLLRQWQERRAEKLKTVEEKAVEEKAAPKVKEEIKEERGIEGVFKELETTVF